MTDLRAKQKPINEENRISVSRQEMDKELTETSKNTNGRELSKQLEELKTFPCKNCDRSFKSELSLSSHCKDKHTVQTLFSWSVQCIIQKLRTNVSSKHIDENGIIKIMVNGNTIFFKIKIRKESLANISEDKLKFKHIKYVKFTSIKCDHCIKHFTYKRDLENHISEEHIPTRAQHIGDRQMPKPLTVKKDILLKQEPIKINYNTQDINENTSNKIIIKDNENNSNNISVKQSFLKSKVMSDIPSLMSKVCYKRNDEQCSSKNQILSQRLTNKNYPENDGVKKRKREELTLKINSAYEQFKRTEKRKCTACYFCNQRFWDDVGLNSHLDWDHYGWRRCKWCWQVLASKPLLYQHLYLVHNIGSRNQKPLKTKSNLQAAAITAKRIKQEIIKVESPSVSVVKIEPTTTIIKTEPLLTKVKVEPK